MRADFGDCCKCANLMPGGYCKFKDHCYCRFGRSQLVHFWEPIIARQPSAVAVSVVKPSDVEFTVGVDGILDVSAHGDLCVSCYDALGDARLTPAGVWAVELPCGEEIGPWCDACWDGVQEDVCGLCGLPGADKIPHPKHWPGEEVPDPWLVHATCEEAECERAHAALTDGQRRAFLEGIR